MNRKTLIAILLALVAITVQGQSFTWRIEGTVWKAFWNQFRSMTEYAELWSATAIRSRWVTAT